MTLPRPEIDPDGLLEYSVVFTDRSLNHMSQRFVGVMQDLLRILTSTYRADTAAVVPGGGSYAMESVARQLADGKRTLVIRNGFFSYRWTQILTTGAVPGSHEAILARPDSAAVDAVWSPAPIDEVVAAIAEQRPELVFAPHVETASGMLLPDDYLRQVAAATHAAGGLFVLDCVASGALWVDMADLGVDILVSAPQKGWSGTPCAGYVMLNEAGREAVLASETSSFSLNLKKWLTIAEGYRDGKHAYHATMPTDGLAHNVQVMREAEQIGLETLREQQLELGRKVRALLAERGLRSVAAEGFEAPGVVVVHTDNPELKTGAAMAAVGVQAAAGVPLMCEEPEGFSTVRFGLFGLDKWADVDACVARLKDALEGADL